MTLIGKQVVKQEEIIALSKALDLYNTYRELKHEEHHFIIDDSLYTSEEFNDEFYYLIHNRWVLKGKKRIDLRKVSEVSKEEIINYLKQHFSSGLEPEYILIPQKTDATYGFYVFNEIHYYSHY